MDRQPWSVPPRETSRAEGAGFKSPLPILVGLGGIRTFLQGFVFRGAEGVEAAPGVPHVLEEKEKSSWWASRPESEGSPGAAELALSTTKGAPPS